MDIQNAARTPNLVEDGASTGNISERCQTFKYEKSRKRHGAEGSREVYGFAEMDGLELKVCARCSTYVEAEKFRSYSPPNSCCSSACRLCHAGARTLCSH